MTEPGEITQWYRKAQGGDAQAAAQLWQEYSSGLLRSAKGLLERRGLPRRAVDEEDVVTAAFYSFLAAASEGQFPAIEDRDAVWRTLLTVTLNEARNVVRKERADKRGGGSVRGDSVFIAAGEAASRSGFDGAADPRRLEADEAAIGLECLERLEKAINEQCEEPQRTAVRRTLELRLQGYSSQEIADELGCSERTITRYLRMLRLLVCVERDETL